LQGEPGVARVVLAELCDFLQLSGAHDAVVHLQRDKDRPFCYDFIPSDPYGRCRPSCPGAEFLRATWGAKSKRTRQPFDRKGICSLPGAATALKSLPGRQSGGCALEA
jgi:hypothetical protein